MKSLLIFLCAFFLACAASIGAVILLAGRPGGTGTSFAELPPHVIYIYGWMPESEQTTYDDELTLLRAAFPESEVEVYQWNSHQDFDHCLEISDNVAEFLASQLAALPESKRREIVLVGHSLGARIAIRAMASPTLQGKPIRRGIFLAAAIPHDAPEIEKAIKNSLEPNISVHNRQDYVLRHLYVLFGESRKNALGAYGYAFPFRHAELLQHELALETRKIETLDEYLSQLERHFAVFYLNELPDILNSLKKRESAGLDEDELDDSTSVEAIEGIMVPQDRPNTPVKVILELGDETVDSCANWKLQHVMMGVYRIVDPLDYQRASGSEQAMRKSFEVVRSQLIDKLDAKTSKQTESPELLNKESAP